jgi:hypothetical protein
MDLDCRKERFGVFCIACSNSTPLLEGKKSIFNQVSQLVKFLVKVSLNLAVFLGRNYYLHSHRRSCDNNGISVISTIPQKRFGIYAFNQLFSKVAIRCGTCCNKPGLFMKGGGKGRNPHEHWA